MAESKSGRGSFTTFVIQELSVPAGKFIHGNKPVIVVDDPKGDFKHTSSVGIAVSFPGPALEKFTHQLLGRPPGGIPTNIDGILGFLEWVPLVIPLF